MSAPPPPPPHGDVPKSSGLPPGKYDIFVIPEHSAGSGFLYLPSLQPNINSFAAGFASALILVAVFQSMAPAFRAWWETFHGMGNMGITLLIVGVGFGAWALGRTQNDAPGSGTSSPGGSGGFGGSGHGPNHTSNSGSAGGNGGPPPPPHSNPPPPNGSSSSGPPPPQPGQDKPKSSWQRPQAPPSPQSKPGTTRNEPPKADTPKGSWEKARDEMRKKEEERKAKEAEQKRRDEAAKRLAELRAKDARERQEREKEREKKETELKTKDTTVKLEREKRDREAKDAREARAREEQMKKDDEARKARVGSSYAYSAMGEKTAMWPNGRPTAPTPSAAPRQPQSPPKRPPAPTAKTYLGTDEDAYSFRPYDQPRQRPRKKSAGSYVGSESSWAPSHTTARTSPPPSVRGPYTTKDPDKVVIHAVYLFMNQFAKTPASQLISGLGSVTDGLILRITTEGLFIDDDVRGVPQREWDVKAWTLKLVEVWCPPHCLNSSTSTSSPAPGTKNSPSLFQKMAGSRARNNADGRDGAKALTGEEGDAYLNELLKSCKDCCRLGLCERTFRDTNIPSSTGQTGEWRSKGLHVLRATARDQEGKRYLFVLDETEGWKLAAGLQRLRKGTQVRQLGVGSMPASDARGILETLGWSG